MRVLKDGFGWTDAESKAGVRCRWQKKQRRIQGSFTAFRMTAFKALRSSTPLRMTISKHSVQERTSKHFVQDDVAE
jgi:hypothetical protein